MTRAEVIVQALAREVRQRATSIDASPDVAEVTVTVKLQAGTTWVRGTVYQEQRVMRSRENARSTGGG